MNKINKILVVAAGALIITVNSACVFAATPVPSKSGQGTTSQTQTPAESSSTAKATVAPSATSKAKATTKATSKATAKATSSAKSTSSSSSATAKTGSNTASGTESSATPEDVDVSAEPTENVTSNSSPLVFSEEADKSNIGTEQNTKVDNGRYTTKGGSFGWFVLSLIVNAIISFVIGNRFYRMSRKDTHVLAEIRAIKKDIDAKMQNNIGGFSEYETVIENANKNYGDKEKNDIKPEEEEVKAEAMASEIYKKWESQVMAAKERENVSKTASRTGSESRVNRSKASRKKHSGGFSKVKDFINDVFPFDKE